MNKPPKTSATTSGSTAKANSGGTKRAARRSTFGKKASSQASQRAAAILEVLAGVRLPTQAARLLNISITHYYLLERKALEGLLAACEVRPRGRGPATAEQRVGQLERELERCQRECQRQAALVRATQRTMGLPPVASAAAKPARNGKSAAAAGKRRRRRPAVRALQAARALAKNSSLSSGENRLEQSSADDKTDRCASQEGL